MVDWGSVHRQIEEDAEKEKKSHFANFKRIVWHSSFLVVIQTVIYYSYLGYPWEIIRHIISLFFPAGLIVSTDLEEL